MTGRFDQVHEAKKVLISLLVYNALAILPKHFGVSYTNSFYFSPLRLALCYLATFLMSRVYKKVAK